MKNISYILLFFCLYLNSQTTYYVSAIGNDSNNGTSTATPWLTTGKVTSETFIAGDNILFNRGDVFRLNGVNMQVESGGSGNPITIGAYGTGAKPMIIGSEQANSGWTVFSGNVWQYSYGSTNDIANIVFNNEATYAVKVQSIGEVNVQGEYWYDDTNSLVKLYSVGNPASFYSDIELVEDTHGINLQSRSNINIINIDLRYVGRVGFTMSTTNNVEISYCNFSFIGGSNINANDFRYGNAIELYGNGTNIDVHHNTAYQIFDAAYTAQGGAEGTWTVDNIKFYNNLSNLSQYSFEFWYRSAGSSVTNVYCENNTFINAGGFGYEQRVSPFATHFYIGLTSAGTQTNVNFRNNIMDNSGSATYRIWRFSDASLYNVDYNVIYETAGNIIQEWSTATNYSYASQIATFQSATGWDTNSVFDNPDLTGYIPNGVSPAIDAGITTAIVTTDFIGTSRPQNSIYDIGAYERLVTSLKRAKIKGGKIKGGSIYVKQ